MLNIELIEDYKYTADFNYNTEHNCDEYCDPYCRCGIITDFKLNKVPDYLIEEITFSNHKNPRKINKKFITNDLITNYCLDRYFVKSEWNDINNWELQPCRGYYGEEVNKVYNIKYEKINEDIKTLINLDNNKKIEFVLKLEYGYILDSIKDKNWFIVEIEKEEIIVPNNYVKLNNDLIEKYSKSESKLPIGIYLKENKKYKLLDGYHRYYSLKEKNGKFLIIAAE